MTDTQKLLAKNLKTIRKEKGLHQADVAERSGVIASTYSRIESCVVSPNLSTLEKLASAMEVPMSEFFYNEELGDKSLEQKMLMIKNLSDYNQNVLEVMIDTVFEKDKLEKLQQLKKQKRLEELEKVRRT